MAHPFAVIGTAGGAAAMQLAIRWKHVGGLEPTNRVGGWAMSPPPLPKAAGLPLGPRPRSPTPLAHRARRRSRRQALDSGPAPRKLVAALPLVVGRLRGARGAGAPRCQWTCVPLCV